MSRFSQITLLSFLLALTKCATAVAVAPTHTMTIYDEEYDINSNINHYPIETHVASVLGSKAEHSAQVFIRKCHVGQVGENCGSYPTGVDYVHTLSMSFFTTVPTAPVIPEMTFFKTMVSTNSIYVSTPQQVVVTTGTDGIATPASIPAIATTNRGVPELHVVITNGIPSMQTIVTHVVMTTGTNGSVTPSIQTIATTQLNSSSDSAEVIPSFSMVKTVTVPSFPSGQIPTTSSPVTSNVSTFNSPSANIFPPQSLNTAVPNASIPSFPGAYTIPPNAHFPEWGLTNNYYPQQDLIHPFPTTGYFPPSVHIPDIPLHPLLQESVPPDNAIPFENYYGNPDEWSNAPPRNEVFREVPQIMENIPPYNNQILTTVPNIPNLLISTLPLMSSLSKEEVPPTSTQYYLVPNNHGAFTLSSIVTVPSQPSQGIHSTSTTFITPATVTERISVSYCSQNCSSTTMAHSSTWVAPLTDSTGKTTSYTTTVSSVGESPATAITSTPLKETLTISVTECITCTTDSEISTKTSENVPSNQTHLTINENSSSSSSSRLSSNYTTPPAYTNIITKIEPDGSPAVETHIVILPPKTIAPPSEIPIFHITEAATPLLPATVTTVPNIFQHAPSHVPLVPQFTQLIVDNTGEVHEISIPNTGPINIPIGNENNVPIFNTNSIPIFNTNSIPIFNTNTMPFYNTNSVNSITNNIPVVDATNSIPIFSTTNNIPNQVNSNLPSISHATEPTVTQTATLTPVSEKNIPAPPEHPQTSTSFADTYNTSTNLVTFTEIKSSAVVTNTIDTIGHHCAPGNDLCLALLNSSVMLTQPPITATITPPVHYVTSIAHEQETPQFVTILKSDHSGVPDVTKTIHRSALQTESMQDMIRELSMEARNTSNPELKAKAEFLLKELGDNNSLPNDNIVVPVQAHICELNTKAFGCPGH